MKQYYETVDVATDGLPTIRGWYLVVCKGETREYVNVTMFDPDNVYGGSKWDADNVISWFRPVSLSDLIREVADESWDACRNWLIDESCPDKYDYINSLK